MRPGLLITKPPRGPVRGPADCVTGTTADPPGGRLALPSRAKPQLMHRSKQGAILHVAVPMRRQLGLSMSGWRDHRCGGGSSSLGRNPLRKSAVQMLWVGNEECVDPIAREIGEDQIDFRAGSGPKHLCLQGERTSGFGDFCDHGFVVRRTAKLTRTPIRAAIKEGYLVRIPHLSGVSP